MARAKRRAGRKAAAKKKPARRRAKQAAAKRKPAAAPTAPRPVVIPGAWPFPMGGKSQ
ncbi:MAG TPA: hypothetical protein VLD15_02945 [Burkholderiales bacterium]|nr:hypothetical protein [Burkholderiales bacterium]